jgi:hypothetical protein
VAMYGARLHLVADPDIEMAPAIRQAMASAGATVASITPVEPSLEDVFVSIVGGLRQGGPAAGVNTG